MLTRLREAVTRQIMRVEIVQRPPPLAPEGDIERLEATHIDPLTGENEMADQPAGYQPQPARNGRQTFAATAGAAASSAAVDPKNPATWGKVQRNAPCPCGSGKKYKHCHGKLA
jgi:preprotein translocase subunit SecA